MQSIMWIILAATIGLAAVVNYRQRGMVNADLGEPRRIDGLSIRLPRGWNDAEERIESNALIEVDEPHFELWSRTISVSFGRPSFDQVLRTLGGNGDGAGVVRHTEKIELGGEEAVLAVRRKLEYPSPRGSIYLNTTSAARQFSNGRILSITLRVYTRGGKDEMQRDIDLIKRIAASVEVDPPADESTSE